MKATLRRILEALALRMVPGVLNLVALLSLAGWLGAERYGLFSTAIATSGAAAAVLFGPLTSVVLVSHARALTEASLYEGRFLGLLLLLAGGLGGLLALLTALEWLNPVWILPIVPLGLQLALQEVLHARLSLVRFGAAALVQALALQAAFWAWVRLDPSVEAAVQAFAASYLAGALASWILAGRFAPRRPDLPGFRDLLRIGLPVALSNQSADVILLGYRYLLLGAGALPLLGLFSFCLDLAQRLIGYMINIATFALLPQAFGADAAGDRTGFRRILLDGLKVSVAIAAALLATVLAVAALGWVPALETDLFHPVAFAAIAVGVVANRTGRMIFIPLAVRAGRPFGIAATYLAAAPATLGLCWLGLATGRDWLALGAYPTGFVLWVGLNLLVLRRGRR